MSEVNYQVSPDDVLLISKYELSGRPVPYPISHRDAEADTRWAKQYITNGGIKAPQKALFISTSSEYSHIWPFQAACESERIPILLAENSMFDAKRTEMFLRRFDVALVIGVGSGVLDGLEATGRRLDSVFGRSRLVLAREGAAERLVAAGIAASAMLFLGPAVAIAKLGGGLVYNEAEWFIEERGGKLLVTARNARAHPIVRLETGLAGRVVETGSRREVFVNSGVT